MDLFREFEKSMREDREATERFKNELEKYGVSSPEEILDTEEDNPFTGGNIPMM